MSKRRTAPEIIAFDLPGDKRGVMNIRHPRFGVMVKWPIADVESVARVVGPSSAAQQALEEYARRSRCYPVAIFKAGEHWVVGPDLEAAAQSPVTSPGSDD